MHKYRTHTCSEITKKNSGATVKLSGWIHRKRDHGNLLFFDLRDHFGLTQCVIENSNNFFKIVEKIKPESVVCVSGKVVNRSADTINKDLFTGEVEIKISSFEILSESMDLPMPVFGEQDYPEETRLKYRFLDLRRQEMHENIVLRSKVIYFIRNKMIADGFLEFQTPILTASSPEGARDFLVPSRMHPGKFYALPQAPQQFKQMVMISGFDKYFQIAPCFRDEDGRADRSPGEHYQLDMEMSFVEQDDVFNAMEPIFFKLFTEFGKGKTVSKTPFKKITYKEAENVGEIIIKLFSESQFDVCKIFYNKFKNVISQIPQEQQIIPIENQKKEELKKSDNFYEFEPEENEILNNLLPRNISTQIFKAFLENAASEQGSRMTAMDNATRNAGDLVDKLTITYNRSRQAAITKELIEIISGAESL